MLLHADFVIVIPKTNIYFGLRLKVSE